MHFKEGYTYHIYNRSNETVFQNDDNYLYFLGKVKDLIYPFCDILAWCLMPNHFHFLIKVKEKGAALTGEKHRPHLQQLSKNIGVLISSYTSAFNKSYQRKGSLFSHTTKAKQLNFSNNNYAAVCFFYIHRNPFDSGLVEKIEDWRYSSIRDFAGIRNGKLINQNVAHDIINFDKENFIEQSYIVLKEKDIKLIF